MRRPENGSTRPECPLDARGPPKGKLGRSSTSARVRGLAAADVVRLALNHGHDMASCQGCGQRKMVMVSSHQWLRARCAACPRPSRLAAGGTFAGLSI
jgi:hypothetical protein